MSKGFPRKILVSGGFGAGWSSWCSCDTVAQFMAEYEPIIKALEKNPKLKLEEHDPLVVQMCEEIENLFGEYWAPYLGGLDGLYVKTVYSPYRITDYDGSESVTESESNDWFY